MGVCNRVSLRWGVYGAKAYVGMATFLSATILLSSLISSFGEAASTARDHSNNWAILVDASRYWFNYRHSANALAIYHEVKRLGIPDSQIILMLADDFPCNPRNTEPGTVFTIDDHKVNSYGENVEVDYRGCEVTVKTLISVMTGRHSPEVPRSKRLLTDQTSNVLIYLSGHGGDEFLKFQDVEELSSVDLADALEQMRLQRRFNEVLFMVDTCQAATMYKRFYTPNVLSVGSSLLGQNSYGYVMDNKLGLALMDRMTLATQQFLSGQSRFSKASVNQLFSRFTRSFLFSDVGVQMDFYPKELTEVVVTDFFGSVLDVQPTLQSFPGTEPIARGSPLGNSNFVPSRAQCGDTSVDTSLAAAPLPVELGKSHSGDVSICLKDAIRWGAMLSLLTLGVAAIV